LTWNTANSISSTVIQYPGPFYYYLIKHLLYESPSLGDQRQRKHPVILHIAAGGRLERLAALERHASRVLVGAGPGIVPLCRGAGTHGAKVTAQPVQVDGKGVAKARVDKVVRRADEGCNVAVLLECEYVGTARGRADEATVGLQGCVFVARQVVEERAHVVRLPGALVVQRVAPRLVDVLVQPRRDVQVGAGELVLRRIHLPDGLGSVREAAAAAQDGIVEAVADIRGVPARPRGVEPNVCALIVVLQVNNGAGECGAHYVDSLVVLGAIPANKQLEAGVEGVVIRDGVATLDSIHALLSEAAIQVLRRKQSIRCRLHDLESGWPWTYQVAIRHVRASNPHVRRVPCHKRLVASLGLGLLQAIGHGGKDGTGILNRAEKSVLVNRRVGSVGVLRSGSIAGPEAVGVTADDLGQAGVPLSNVVAVCLGTRLVENDGSVVPATVNVATPARNHCDEDAVLGGLLDGPVDMLEVGVVRLEGIGVEDGEVAVEVGSCSSVEFGENHSLYNVEPLAGSVLEIYLNITAVQAVEQFP
jgi:hypothetical protein